MPTINGHSTNIAADVNTKNQLLAMTTSIDIESYYSEHGHSYNINTRAITLTDANESQLLYIKNTGVNHMVIKSLFYLIGTSTGGSDITAIPRNLGKNPVPGATIWSGSDITGLTDDGTLEFILLDTVNRLEHIAIASRVILPPGKAVALIWEPATGILTGLIALMESAIE